jgi:drug/metabolite transporter (DMT)-like permease
MGRHRFAIVASLLFTIFLWGGNNTGIKYLVQSWPPIWVGSTRFIVAGLLMLTVLRWTDWLGKSDPPSAALNGRLWCRGGLSLAVYIVLFNWGLRFASASHMALYLGASPVWALVWEGRAGEGTAQLLKRAVAAGLALLGVFILFWPALRSTNGSWPGELMGISASVMWVVYGRQCRALGQTLSGVEVTAHTMWRAGVLLVPFAALETGGRMMVHWDMRLALIQLYCIVGGGVIAFALWNNALRHWKTSEVYLFNNLIPASTMLWAYFCLGEPMTPTFWAAMGLIAAGVIIGQANWEKMLGNFWTPVE